MYFNSTRPKYYRNEETDYIPTPKLTFPKYYKFSKVGGIWSIIKDGNVIGTSKDIEEFKDIKGDFVKNDTHNFGYKYNRLYKHWKAYCFKTERYL